MDESSPNDDYSAEEGAARSDDYRTLVELGRGGMARVYLAVRLGAAGFRRFCALKRMRSDSVEAAQFPEMFLREARIAARMNHPNVLSTLEVGCDSAGYFIAMEYLEGQSYAALLARAGRTQLPFAVSLRVLIEVLKALEYAHSFTDFDGTAMCVVHRDVSPSNIFITYDGAIKLLDFGIAKVLDTPDETKVGMLKGKLNYLAPEQVKGFTPSIQSDLYAIGVQLWEAAAGRRRWQDVPHLTIFRHLMSGDPPESPNAVERGLPAEVDAVCVRALAADPRRRFASAREFRAVLEDLLRLVGDGVDAGKVGQLLAQHFAVDRDQLRAVVDTELRRLESEGELSHRQSGTLLKFRPDGGDPLPSSRRSLSVMGAITTPVEPRPARPVRSRGVWQRLAAAAGVAGLAAFVILHRPWAMVLGRFHPHTPAASGPSAAPAFEISVKPAAARLFANGLALPSNPYVMREPLRAFRLRAEADGYSAEERTIVPTSGGHVELALAPAPAPTNASDTSHGQGGGWAVKSRHPSFVARPAPPVSADSDATDGSHPAPSPAPEALSDAEAQPFVRRAKASAITLDAEDPWKH